MDDENRERVLRFLLDDLGPEERAGVEERCFTDDEFFLAVEAQEEQTLRDYLVGGLSPAQRRLFESRYFATPAMRRRLDDTQRAILAVGRAGRGLAAAQPSLSRRVGKWVRPRSPGGGFVYAAVGVVVVASLGVEVWRLAGQVERLEAGGPGARVSFFLQPGRLRGPGGATRRAMTRGAAVGLQLELNSHRDEKAYRVYVTDTKRAEIWSGEVASTNRSPSGDSLQVLVSPGVFRPGEYIVTLQAPGPAGFETFDEYVLSISNRSD